MLNVTVCRIFILITSLIASGRMHILLTLLINSMVIHGHWPPELLNSTIVSIPKDNRGSLSNSENYRGIALSNCICKIIDTVLLNKYSAFLATSSLQFAFKKHHSTVLSGFAQVAESLECS